MKRTPRSVPVGEGTRHRVTIEDDLSTGPDIVTRQFKFLQELATDGLFSGMLNCGPVPFETLTMRHDGLRWVVVLEAMEISQ
jgi:hypothetical protein